MCHTNVAIFPPHRRNLTENRPHLNGDRNEFASIGTQESPGIMLAEIQQA